jgi:hypothetical protein
MDLQQLINHPEQMNKETLYELRSLVALYPYYQTARLLMLQNLYLMHDSTFDEELRKTAIYITDRKQIFNLVEAAHYKMKSADSSHEPQPQRTDGTQGENRTVALIDQFLDSLPDEQKKEKKAKTKRHPTPADAAVDYVAYLLETEEETPTDAPQAMKGQHLIDNFIDKEQGKIQLKETPEFLPPVESTAENTEKDADEGFYTETLARIYIKQGKYSKALEIIKRLNLNNPKKSVYFADQIRFLEKLIINNNKK